MQFVQMFINKFVMQTTVDPIYTHVSEGNEGEHTEDNSSISCLSKSDCHENIKSHLAD